MKDAIRDSKAIVANPREKQRSCEILQVPPNKVFRALVRHFLLNKDFWDSEIKRLRPKNRMSKC